MKKRYIYFVFLFTFLAFSHCKKKDVEPEGTSTPAPTASSGSLTVSAITQVLSAESVLYADPDHYTIKGTTASGNYKELNADFYNGKPTQDAVVALSPLHAHPTLNIIPNDNMYSYSAISGEVSIKVIGSTVSISFTNVVFMRVNDSQDKITASGTLVVLN